MAERITGRFTFTALTLALSALIVIAGLILPENEIQASGIAQGRIFRVKENARFLNKVIKLKVNNSDNPVTKNVELSIQVINFGDGTGYVIGQPYPNTGKISLASPERIPGRNEYNRVEKRGILDGTERG